MGITAEDIYEPCCNILGIGANSDGHVYGNYTSKHCVLNNQARVVKHGATSKLLVDSLFAVSTNSPFGINEAGIKYSVIANYYPTETYNPLVSFSHYFLLSKALFGLVRRTSTIWLSSNSHNNITDAKIKHAETINPMME